MKFLYLILWSVGSDSSSLQKAKQVSALGVPGSDTKILISHLKSFFLISSERYSSAVAVTFIIINM